jgi:ketosteroid isomerase-like protein
MGNAQTVKELYEAFGRGDVAFILERLSESVEWEYGAGVPNDVPWLQRRTGRAGAADFFASLSLLDFHKFLPKHILEGPGVVVGLVDVEAVVKRTGKRFSQEDEVHLFWFDAEGLISRFCHRMDTHGHVWAWQEAGGGV